MFGTKGQKVANLDEAEEFIREFLVYGQEHRGELAADRAHDFDLFLPWMMEIVVNADEEEGSRPPAELDTLYMDAAWSLVQKGYLRPGPRRVSGENMTAGYGKGFALTPKGRSEWFQHHSEHPASGEAATV